MRTPRSTAGATARRPGHRSPCRFHQNQLWDLSVPVTLKKGSNVIEITSKELPGFDGVTYLSDTFPGVRLVSQYAPNIDRISVTPLVAATATLSVATTATTRCIGGRVVLTTTATNTGTSPVDIEMTSAFGTKAFTAVAPGRNATHAFTTRQSSVAAGSVTVDSAGTVGGATVTDQQKPAYPAAGCRESPLGRGGAPTPRRPAPLRLHTSRRDGDATVSGAEDTRVQPRISTARSLLLRGAARLAGGLLLLGVAGTAVDDEQEGTDDVDVTVQIAPLTTPGSHSLR